MHNLYTHVIFYIFAALTVISALMVVTQNNPVRCVLFLVLAFISSAVLWIMLNAEFLALILVLVYVGAVMTLFLFVVMMLNIDIEVSKTKLIRYLPYGLIIVALLASLLVKVIPETLFKDAVEIVPTIKNQLMLPNKIAASEVPASNTEALGNLLYTNYVLAFEMAAVILLVAIIAAITLVHRAPIRSKQQSILKQLMTDKDDRVKLVKMKAEKK